MPLRMGKRERMNWEDNFGFRKLRSLFIFCCGCALIACQEDPTVRFGYNAFPDILKTADGKIVCVFYNGWSHVSKNNKRVDAKRNGGRIMMAVSSDSAKTWSPPRVIIDTDLDDRDPSLLLSNSGEFICNFFSLEGTKTFVKLRTEISRSSDGTHWSEPQVVAAGFATSSPVVQVGTEFWMPVYDFETSLHSKSLVLKSNNGKIWSEPVLALQDHHTSFSEPFLISIQKRLLMVSRADDPGRFMHATQSFDQGKTWSEKIDLGFPGQAPFLYLYADSLLLLAHRDPLTSIRYAEKSSLNFSSPIVIDPDSEAYGGYPSIAPVDGKRILIAYYAELSPQDAEIRFRYCDIDPDGLKIGGILSNIKP